MNILIVEDERLIAESLKNGLKQMPIVHLVEIAEAFEKAYDRAMSGVFDIILIDISLGKGSFSGLDLCAAVRRSQKTLPIVIITAYHSLSFLEQAFAMGVNDYITKPFRMQEVQLRVHRWISHSVAPFPFLPREVISYGELSYFPLQNLFFWGNKPIFLTKKKKELLSIFFQHREVLLSREFLQAKLWGDLDGENRRRNLRASVQMLRESLPEMCKIWLCTVRGEGYLLQKKED